MKVLLDDSRKQNASKTDELVALKRKHDEEIEKMKQSNQCIVARLHEKVATLQHDMMVMNKRHNEEMKTKEDDNKSRWFKWTKSKELVDLLRVAEDAERYEDMCKVLKIANIR